MHAMQSMAIQQHPFWDRPCMATHFCSAIAHIGLFELPSTSNSGHSGQTGASLDVVRWMSALSLMSARSLTALYFFTSFFPKKQNSIFFC
jgi:hypothetical protein